MKKSVRGLCVALCVVGACAGGLTGCGKNPDAGYFEEVTAVTLNRNLGGSDTLTLSEDRGAVTLENGKFRIVFNRNSGSVREVANKETGVYLTKDAKNAFPVRVVQQERTLVSYVSFEMRTLVDSAEEKKLQFRWGFSKNLEVISTCSLVKDADEAVFGVSVRNNRQSDTVLAVEYPVVEEIGSLHSGDTDCFVSPFVTGYLFRDPTENFNREDGAFSGITREYGLYPSGWECPMQFQAYYSEGAGGFFLSTRDGGNGIKSFTCTGSGEGKLRMSVYHYLDDVREGDTEFAYETALSNLTSGSWQAAGQKYRAWALQQSWAQQGRIEQREINRDFYENTTLANFNFPYSSYLDEHEQEAIYDKLKAASGGKMLNVLFNTTDNANALSKKNGDYLTYFEFNTFYPINGSNQTFLDNAMMDSGGGKPVYKVNDTSRYYYECAANLDWRQEARLKEQSYLAAGADGLYHDVCIAAVHPKQCFDVSHAHGTRVNVVGDFVAQVAEAKQLAGSEGLVGQELIFEQLLPYLDFYQARANAGTMGWMEGDRVREAVADGYAEKIPLFDYVYSGYAGRRLDGYAYADEMLGGAYYHAMAVTALFGGIPEYNYEFLNFNDYLTAEETSGEMLAYLTELGKMRTSYGKEYLTYGSMARAPRVGTEKASYRFFQRNYDGGKGFDGTYTADKVVTSAFTYGKSTAIFLSNVTGAEMPLRFILKAGEFYGVETGKVKLWNGTELVALTDVAAGRARVDLTLSPRKVAMLVVENV